jgi:cytochrome P450
MTDSEIMDELTTFFFAGSDPIALAITWCIHLLSLNTTVQDRLRQELLSLARPTSSDSTAIDSMAIDSLAYLDAVVHESLRICPPVHSSIRFATRDDIIPLSKPVVLRDGTTTCEVKIRKGSVLHIPIEGLNTSKEIWGQDAHEFK